MPPRVFLPKNSCICLDDTCTVEHGFCHCGCGQKTNIAKNTVKSRGHVKGEPVKFLPTHGSAHDRINCDELSCFKIGEVDCRLIALTKGLFAIVNASDYDRISRFRWHASWNECSRCFYAVRNVGNGKSMSMHREVLGLKAGDRQQVDHVDPLRTIENVRNNLRLATSSQNRMNMRIRKDNKTGFKGVHFYKKRGNYTARINVDGRTIFIGYFPTAEAANEARIKELKEHHGQFARIE